MHAALLSPNGAQCNSPGQRPGEEQGLWRTSPDRAEYRAYFAPLGLDMIRGYSFPGRCPGLLHVAPLELKQCCDSIKIYVISSGQPAEKFDALNPTTQNLFDKKPLLSEPQ